MYCSVAIRLFLIPFRASLTFGEKLLKMVETNELVLKIDGKPMDDMKLVKKFFDEKLDPILKELAENALLIE